MKQLICLLSGFLLTITACKPDPKRTVNIHIMSPEPGSEYDRGDTVWLKASAGSNKIIDRMEMEVRKISNDSLVYLRSFSIIDNAAGASDFFVNHFNPHADLKLVVRTFENQGLETGSKQSNFHCHAH